MSLRLNLSLVALAFAIEAPSMPAHAEPFIVEESVTATCCLITASLASDQAGGRLSGADFSFQGGGFFLPANGSTGRFFASGDAINLSGSVAVTPDLTVALHGTNWITAGGHLNFQVPSTHDVQVFGNQFRIPAQSFFMDGLIAADSLHSPERLNLSVAGIGTAIAFGRLISDPGDPNLGKLEVTTIQYAFSQSVIPEPATWLLLGTGFVALLCATRRVASR